jgi:hypothetical protein
MSRSITTFYQVTWVFSDGEISWKTCQTAKEAELEASVEQTSPDLIGVHVQDVNITTDETGIVIDVDLGHRVSYVELLSHEEGQWTIDRSRRQLAKVDTDRSSF